MRTGIKTHGHNLRFDCNQCKEEDKMKKRRLAPEKGLLEDSGSDGEGMDVEDDRDEDGDGDEENDEAEGTVDNKRKRTGENSSHCHSSLFKVTDEMKNFMRGGQPFRRCREAEKKKRDENIVKKNIREEIRKTDKAKEQKDLQSEVLKLKAKLRQEARERTLLPKVKLFSVIHSQIFLRTFVFHVQTKTPTAEEKKQERDKRRKQLEEEREAKRRKFSLLF